MLLPDPEKDLAFNMRRRERVLEALSPRELEYIGWVLHADEFTNRDIADRMNVGVDRVGEFAKSVKKKLGIRSKEGLVHFACEWRLVPMYGWGVVHAPICTNCSIAGTLMPFVLPSAGDGGGEVN